MGHVKTRNELIAEHTRVYIWPGKRAHLVSRPMASKEAICGFLSFTWEWLGTGSQEEYERAEALLLCKRCSTKINDLVAYMEFVAERGASK